MERNKKRGIEWQAKKRAHLRQYQKQYRPSYILNKLRAQPWATLLKAAQLRAKRKGLLFTLDNAWFAQRWTGCCELTGIPFSPPEKRVGYKNRNLSPSVDRIDPIKPYTKENCQIIIWAINSLKRDGSLEEMYHIAEALISHRTSIAQSI
jgi:hypothetical protein